LYRNLKVAFCHLKENKMKQIELKKDIKVFYITAKSFPEGVLEAHQMLHALIPFSKERQYFGISYPNTEGVIMYKSAAEILNNEEAEKYNLEVFTIKKGHYISVLLKDYQKDISLIDKTFKQLLSDPRLDHKGYCLEVYLNEKDMQCMVKIN
jgi:predicted transcriptional regulator YdeE